MKTILGVDAGNVVRLLSTGPDASVMPDSWNGMAITAIVLTDAQADAYAALSPDRSAVKFDGNTFTVVPVAAIPLPDMRLAANAAIDTAAGGARLKYITECPGQAGTYLMKAQQADAYKAAGYTGIVPSFISAEASATGKSAQQVADTILVTRDYWIGNLAPAIEGARIGGKANVAAATDAAGINAARDAALTKIGAL